MTRSRPSDERTKDSLLAWFGLRRISGQAGCTAPADEAGQIRRQLLGRISQFLIENGLEITPDNLLIAHGLSSGSNPVLMRRIKARQNEGRPITRSWLARAAASESDTADLSLERLADRLEEGIDGLSENTRNVRDATSQYASALEAHVGKLESGVLHSPHAVIEGLAEYAKAMLERSRKAEEALLRREQETSRLRTKLARARKDAEIDYLTGLHNRRGFETLLEQHHREAMRTLMPACIAFCDIDHFKAVNDEHGHQAGDRVLKMVVRILVSEADENCHIARYGGEEFALLFRNSTTDEALQSLDKARCRLSARRLVNRQTCRPFGTITFSGGIANLHDWNNTTAALTAADQALYLAKESGRNRIIIADPDQTG
ncbi:MAG: diguanylate cyclase [Sphingomonadaceae bacterium]